jgi:hypothetical protein
MPGFPDKFTPFYKRPPGSRASTATSRLAGSFIRPLRRMSQLERNREPRWRDEVPTGWALAMDKVTMTHRFVEFFYHRLQYFRSNQPGRHTDVEKYHSGYVPPAEAAYGEHYHKLLPNERLDIAKQRGLPLRDGLSPQAEGFQRPLAEQ